MEDKSIEFQNYDEDLSDEESSINNSSTEDNEVEVRRIDGEYVIVCFESKNFVSLWTHSGNLEMVCQER